MLKTAIYAVFLLVLHVPVLAGTLDSRAPLERTVSLDIWAGGLADVIREVKQQTGVDIIPYPPDFPAESHSGNLYLVSGDVQLRTLLECLARRYSFRYRLSNAGRVELSKCYDWAAVEPVLKFPRLDALIPANTAPDTVQPLLGELVKPLALLGGEYSLTLERSPTRENPQSVRAVVVMPPVLADYAERAINCLAGDPGDSRAGARTPSAFAVGWNAPVQ